jgi:SAM-dependent methyltransferase
MEAKRIIYHLSDPLLATMMAMRPTTTTAALLVGAVGGAAFTMASSHIIRRRRKRSDDPETSHAQAHSLVWKSIGGAMNAAMLYVGDRLQLYKALAELCSSSSSSFTTAIELAEHTGLNRRWLREWLAQQAAMGVVQLLPGEGDDDASLRYRLPSATAEVLANPDSPEYDISMIQAVPSLVNRAKTMLPEAFRTGIGLPYDESDVAEAIDRQHLNAVRNLILPVLLPKIDGDLVERLERGCKVADLGCGAGVLLIQLAQAFPKSSFHGFEISEVALDKAAHNVASARLTNVYLHNANDAGEALGDVQWKDTFDVVFIYDVLHDSTDPANLVCQVLSALKPKSGRFILGDIPSKPTVRENLAEMRNPNDKYGFSICLCMSCALSEPGGAGLGTLGFSVPVAKKMLRENGFPHCEVVLEDTKHNIRWFLAKKN